MTEHNPTPYDREFERLLPRLFDEGDKSALVELEALLANNPEAIDSYIRYVSVHYLLNLEVNSLGMRLEALCGPSEKSLTPAIQEALRRLSGGPPAENPVPVAKASAAERRRSIARRRPAWALRSHLPGWMRAPFVASAASLIIAVLAAGTMGAAIAMFSLEGGIWRLPGELYTAEEIIAAERWLADKRSEQGPRFGQVPVPATGMWADIVPIIEPPAKRSTGIGFAELQPGVVSLEPFNGAAGVGYLLALPPGHGMEVLVDVESIKENALIVKRVSPQGRLTGQTHSFSNQDIHTQPGGVWHAGRIGYWADFNEYDQTRYYLLCGANRQTDSPTRRGWTLSDFMHQQVRSGLLYIGWDDGAMHYPMDTSDGAIIDSIERVSSSVDADYNDICAIVRIRRPEDIRLEGARRVFTAPEPEQQERFLAGDPDGFVLRVEPEQSVVIHVSSRAEHPYALALVDQHDQRVWWNYENVIDGRELGLYSIDNHTDEPVELRLVGGAGPAAGGTPFVGADPFRVGGVDPIAELAARITSPRRHSYGVAHKVIIQDKDYWEIGYDQSASPPEDSSFNSIRVRVHWVQ